MKKNVLRLLLLVLSLPGIVLIPPAVAADNDVVVINNGDRLTGELKLLERGKLRFKTAATDTISIEWDEVARLSSQQNIQVETERGDRYLGQLVDADARGTIVVNTGAETVELSTSRIVAMHPIEARGIERFDGDITAGYNFAKASEVQQAQFGLSVQARTEIRTFGLDISSAQSNSEDNESSQRHSLDFSYRRQWPDRWLTGAVLRLDRNDELELDLRTSVGLGGGRNVVQTNNSTLSLIGGVQVSRENVASGLADEDTIEAFGTLSWDWFRDDTPELDLSTDLRIIPNLTDSGRIRAELDISLKWEMIEDLFWQLEVYDTYDSDPVVTDAEKNDYGVITSLGWEF